MAFWPSYPCRNPNCKSKGKPHPNCQCGKPGTRTDSGSTGFHANQYADGGVVHFCSQEQAHEPGCEYFADGGQVMPFPNPPAGAENDDPSATLGHAAIEHGLVGLLGGAIGDAGIKDPEKHARILDDAKSQHRHRSLGPSHDGKEEQGPKKSAGTRLGDHFFEGKHHESAELLGDHPLVGSVGKKVLEPIMARLAQPMLDKDTHPEALRGSVDYLASSARGAQKLDHETGRLMEKGKLPTHLQEMSRESSRNELKEKLESIQANPSQLLDISGSLGHYLPEHAGQMGATAAQATQYLASIKPKPIQNGPLDEVTDPDPVSVDNYDRQLDIANHPLIVFEHIKDGTLQSQDLTTLSTIYPGLHKSLVSKVGEELIKAKSADQEIPYNQRMALSLVLGQPLDSTMTSASMMAIISSSANAQDQSQSQGGAGRQGTTAATQKTIAKTDSLYETNLDRIQIDRRA